MNSNKFGGRDDIDGLVTLHKKIICDRMGENKIAIYDIVDYMRNMKFKNEIRILIYTCPLKLS